MSDRTGMTDEELNAAIRAGVADAHAAVEPYPRRCCMIQLRREWGRFSNFSFRTPQHLL